jgi:hypothetical protein
MKSMEPKVYLQKVTERRKMKYYDKAMGIRISHEGRLFLVWTKPILNAHS